MNRLILYLLTVALPLFVPAMIFAQSKGGSTVSNAISKIDKKNVTGTVLDENGDPLPGASVMIEGTSEGTATDADGNFSLLVHKPGTTLVVSYVGMETSRIKVEKSPAYLQIKLSPSKNMMDEIVVTGYQNIKRSEATGSYQVLTSADLDKRSVSDLSSNLEGKIPGLVKSVKKSSKDEDAFTIRGVGTFESATAPLVVVDGLPIDGGMSTVNPYDIENITVLKDAAAASIYGARASNGVIVITTKRARDNRLSIDFNADLTVSEKQDYSNMQWANAAQMIELEKYNFKAMLDEPNHVNLTNILQTWQDGRVSGISPVMRQMLANYTGAISDDELNSTLDKWSRNDYRKEYQEVHDRSQVLQQYNLALRSQGKLISSSLVLNYSTDNMGIQNENSNSLTFKYRGDIKAAKWLDVSLGINVLNTRTKIHEFGTSGYGGINSFLPYQSMYNDDGSLARMEAEVYPGLAAFENPDLELKDCSFNLVEEMNRNFNKRRYTNTRAYVHTNFKLLPGWTASAQFQYEDIFSTSRTHFEADSYMMRRLYSTYTTGGTTGVWVDDPDFDLMDLFMHPENYPEDQWFHLNQKYEVQHLPTVHHVPDGGCLSTNTSESKYYTFRAQTNYNRTFGRHSIDALAGFEFRENRSNGNADVYYGYENRGQSNKNMAMDWEYLNNPVNGVFGDNVLAQGMAGSLGYFGTWDMLHRFYSLYMTGNYVYADRYSVSGSYRVDKTDLFGTDPKFRGRPLWSVGASWNAHNESLLRDYKWLNALKLRASYGLTGNINSDIKSVLVASIKNNPLTNQYMMGDLISPPNDQLRWEKTATWNFGVDFAFLGYRLNGSLDYYHKKGTDLLTYNDLDRTSGWEGLTLNSGNMVNHGIELQLDGRILQPSSRSDLGISLGFNIAYNKNKVTKVSSFASSGAEYLGFSLKEAYPLNSIFSYDYVGLVEKNGQYVNAWRDHNGEVHDTPISDTEAFKQEDAIYCGTATPKVVGAFTPEITWHGFTLSAMFNFYAGHMMRIGTNEWYTGGNAGGYAVTFGDGAVPAAALNYWRGDRSVPGNGIASDNYTLSYASYRNDNVVHADYLKLRNIVLSYNFDRKLCRHIGLKDLRLRFQVNNLCTWARNSHGIDPEAWSGGAPRLKTPRSYTMSLFFNL